MSVHIKVGRYV